VKECGETEINSKLDLYDIVFVGAGISTTFSLLNFIEQLHTPHHSETTATVGCKNKKPLKILVVDKSGEFWTGIPYGKRSSNKSLIITSLEEFIPKHELVDFIEWLKVNGESFSAFKEDYQNWSDLFIPRYIFGLYIKEKITIAIKKATSVGLIKLDYRTCEIIGIKRLKDSQNKPYLLTCINEINKSDAFIHAEKVVLALGSPPIKQPLLDLQKDSSNLNMYYVKDVYSPSQDKNLNNIAMYLSSRPVEAVNNVVILGSNASALEVLYNISNDFDSIKRINKIFVISPSGAFPHKITKTKSTVFYVPQALTALLEIAKRDGQKKLATVSALNIFLAVQSDIASASNDSLVMSNIYHEISACVLKVLNFLSPQEERSFVSKYGVEIGKLMRRAGEEYLITAELLKSCGKLEMIAGSFTSCSQDVRGRPKVEYISSLDAVLQSISENISVVVNCTGFQDVTNSSSSLIEDVLSQRMCEPTDANRGLKVNEKFELAENCFLIGPLIAGNCNSKIRVWHAESCVRIISLAQQLAGFLA
jgi:uncharacterized NAD(P)/FAD-binding protein YdhS